MIRIPVTDRSEVAEARRQCAAIAQSLGFDETETGRVSLVATELATNLVKHAGGGEILCGAYEDTTGAGLEIISLDRGPGMADVDACLRDGYSTAGSSGHGLGAIRRQSEHFELVSKQHKGTAILVRLTASRERPASPPAAWGAVAIAKPGEEVCGDGWAVETGPAGLTLMVADGLGHGPAAANASAEAVRVFRRHPGAEISQVLTYIHQALRATRGAAVSLARFQSNDKVSFAGIGNVAGLLAAGGESRRMVSMNGTAGHNARRIQAFDYAAGAHAICILHSDGIATSWSFTDYAAHAGSHPTLLAAMIYRDHGRGRDDATVLIAKGAA